MKVQRDSKKQKGFTLVELLIVIVIIGILAGAMMMLMGSSTDKAEATKVISDLRTMKGAVLQYYSDNSTYPTDADDLNAYVDKDLSGSDYALVTSVDEPYVGRIVPSNGAGEKLGLAASNDHLILYEGTATSVTGTLVSPTNEPTKGEFVFIQGN